MTVADKLQTIAENQQKVYDAGKSKEWSDIWDDIQRNGERTDYNSAFRSWDLQYFKPKYDILPTNCHSMFRGANGRYTDGREDYMVDLAEKIKESGIVFDTSQSTSNNDMFFYSYGISHLPAISCVSATSIDGMVRGCPYVHTIDKIIFSDNGSVSLNNVLASCTNLINVVIEGVIGRSWNLQDCRVISPDSMKSIITHLKDYSGTDNEYAYTLSFRADRWEALEADSTSPSGGTWKDYVKELGWNAV